MMARTPGLHQTVKTPIAPVPEVGFYDERVALIEEIFESRQVNKGMITSLTPENIDPGAGTLLQNANVRYDETIKRGGTVLYSPAKPDVNPVLAMAFFVTQAGAQYTVRFTNNTVYVQTSPTTWVQVVGNLIGGPNDYFDITSIYDPLTAASRFVFANNGANNLQVFTPSSSPGTFGDLSVSAVQTNYRYVTAFNNRVVAAALRGTNEIQIGWSGDTNYTIWDAAVDQSAGNQPLINSPSDATDFITGIFNYTNILVVFRQRSIWYGNITQVETDPFYFYCATAGIGCDAPASIAQIHGGFAWFDSRTGTVWAYFIGSPAPTPIGRNVEATLRSGITDPATIFGAFDPQQLEYTVYVPQVSSTLVLAWTYNFRTQAWTQQIYNNIASCSDTFLGNAGTTIAELQGTIAQLKGTIAGLSPAQPTIHRKVFGLSTGDITYEDAGAYHDNCALLPGGVIDNTTPGTVNPLGVVATSTFVPFTWKSKAFRISRFNMMIHEIRIEYQQTGTGIMQLFYSKDGGFTDLNWTPAENYSVINLGTSFIIRFRKPIRTRVFAFKLVATVGTFKILGYEVHYAQAGLSISPDTGTQGLNTGVT